MCTLSRHECAFSFHLNCWKIVPCKEQRKKYFNTFRIELHIQTFFLILIFYFIELFNPMDHISIDYETILQDTHKTEFNIFLLCLILMASVQFWLGTKLKPRILTISRKVATNHLFIGFPTWCQNFKTHLILSQV